MAGRSEDELVNHLQIEYSRDPETVPGSAATENPSDYEEVSFGQLLTPPANANGLPTNATSPALGDFDKPPRGQKHSLPRSHLPSPTPTATQPLVSAGFLMRPPIQQPSPSYPWYKEQWLPPISYLAVTQPAPQESMHMASPSVAHDSQRHLRISGIVRMLFDDLETNFPFIRYSIHRDRSRQFLFSEMPQYLGTNYVSSHLWQRETGQLMTSCMAIAMPYDRDDGWVIIRLKYDVGMVRLFDPPNSGSGDRDRPILLWEAVQRIFGNASPLLDTSRLRKEEGEAKFTRCAWIRAGQPGEDIFLGFCVGNKEARAILSQCVL